MPIKRRTSLLIALGTIIPSVCVVALLSGPLFPFKPAPSSIALRVENASDLDLYLKDAEAQHAGVRPDLAKTVLWNDPKTHGRTPLALVYLHGFSASRRDISPVAETLAGMLGANAFLTRLAAHGLASPAEFATVTPQDWLDDAREALAIGKRIGDRVILMGISTGALLATMAALEDNSPRLAALILLSPNFAIADQRAKFVSGPLGPWWARMFIGEDYSFAPDSSGHAAFWTSRYPSHGIVALMDLVNYAQTLRLSELTVPTLIIYTDKDTVVDTSAIEARFDEIQSAHKLIVDLPEATRHELTGDALAPQTVRPVLARIVGFLSTIGIRVKLRSPQIENR